MSSLKIQTHTEALRPHMLNQRQPLKSTAWASICPDFESTDAAFEQSLLET